jgi:hypothetical protein
MSHEFRHRWEPVEWMEVGLPYHNGIHGREDFVYGCDCGALRTEDGHFYSTDGGRTWSRNRPEHTL